MQGILTDDKLGNDDVEINEVNHMFWWWQIQLRGWSNMCKDEIAELGEMPASV